MESIFFLISKKINSEQHALGFSAYQTIKGTSLGGHLLLHLRSHLDHYAKILILIPKTLSSVSLIMCLIVERLKLYDNHLLKILQLLSITVCISGL